VVRFSSVAMLIGAKSLKAVVESTEGDRSIRKLACALQYVSILERLHTRTMLDVQWTSYKLLLWQLLRLPYQTLSLSQISPITTVVNITPEQYA
jgi:hypothetical protein